MRNTPQKTVYLDNAATTPLAAEVSREMQRVSFDLYGNPSSMHHQGRRALDLLEQSRNTIATALGACPAEINFTGSGTESDNLALSGIAHAHKQFGRHIIVSIIEHKAILASAHRLKEEGFEITYLPVTADGLIDVDACMAAIRPDTILISVMYANNEIGTIQPIGALASLIKNKRGDAVTPLIHTDACQAAGMLPIQIPQLGVDLMTINSSKIYGPKGIGLLYKKNGVQIDPLIVGGDQESGIRAGTENVALAYGFSLALLHACSTQKATYAQTAELRDYFIDELKTMCPDMILNGHPSERLPNNVHVSIPYIEGESLVLQLDQHGICCSTGSACSAVDLTPSHVLRAIGVTDELIHGSLRFSLGTSTSKEDINYTVACLGLCIKTLRSLTAMPNMIHKIQYEK